MSTVEVTIRYATLNESQDVGGKMENYVQVKSVNGSSATEYKTKITEGEKHKPISWNETIAVPVSAGPAAYLEFRVMDQDNISDDVCGLGRLNLQNCGAFSPGLVNKYNVQLHKEKSAENAGALHISTLFR